MSNLLRNFRIELPETNTAVRVDSMIVTRFSPLSPGGFKRFSYPLSPDRARR